MKLKELTHAKLFIENDIRTIEDFYWLLEDKFQLSKIDYYMNNEIEIDDEKFFFYWNELLRKPIQYVLGYAYFLGHKFIVDKNVLIPRNETEELVINIYNKIKNKNNIKVLDIGTGSGAIIMGLELLLKNNNHDYYFEGIDISPNALEIAKLNKKELALNTTLYLSDVFNNVQGRYDIIISNPPYIKKGEFVEKRVENNEPHLALYADNNGLDIYERIFKDVFKHVNDGTILALEIAPERKDGLINLLEKYLPNNKYEFINDINQMLRFLIVYF